jgi:hypothetical protein
VGRAGRHRLYGMSLDAEGRLILLKVAIVQLGRYGQIVKS